MAKPLTCNQMVARAIRKFGLPKVQAAVEMAVELGGPDTTPALKRAPRTKPVAAAATTAGAGTSSQS